MSFLLISKYPLFDARCKGVFILLFLIFVSQLAFNNISTILRFPSSHE